LKLAVLGIDDATLALAAASKNAQHAIVLIDANSDRLEEARRIAPTAKVISDWENALDPGQVDAALLGADKPAERIEQLRRLIQTQMPVVVSHPLSLSMLEAYELDMIRNETHSIVLPYLPGRWHPASAEIGAMVADPSTSPIGAVEQIIFERYMQKREREDVLKQFSRDVDLLQFIAGGANKLHALGSTSGGSPYGNLTVQTTSETDSVCRWTVSPAHDFVGGKLTLIGAAGRVILLMPDASKAWKLDVQTSPPTPAREYAGWNSAAAALQLLAGATAGQRTEPTWTEAARTVELAETIDRSLKRGRTIDLHHEEFTDIGTFKGTMTSVGCAILMCGLVFVVCVALAHLVAVQAGWNQLADWLGYWPYLLLGVLGFYLLLQPLALIGKSREPEKADSD
jgi:predicted dehydrogenase